MPFRHQNGPIMLDSHLHNTCILVLYDEIFQDLYVNNGTNSNSPRPYFDQYEHGEPFISNPVFITWVYLPYATLLCTACDIGKIHSWPIRIQITKLLEKNSFWCRFFFFYEISDINNIYNNRLESIQKSGIMIENWLHKYMFVFSYFYWYTNN